MWGQPQPACPPQHRSGTPASLGSQLHQEAAAICVFFSDSERERRVCVCPRSRSAGVVNPERTSETHRLPGPAPRVSDAGVWGGETFLDSLDGPNVITNLYKKRAEGDLTQKTEEKAINGSGVRDRRLDTAGVEGGGRG